MRGFLLLEWKVLHFTPEPTKLSFLKQSLSPLAFHLNKEPNLHFWKPIVLAKWTKGVALCSALTLYTLWKPLSNVSIPRLLILLLSKHLSEMSCTRDHQDSGYQIWTWDMEVLDWRKSPFEQLLAVCLKDGQSGCLMLLSSLSSHFCFQPKWIISGELVLDSYKISMRVSAAEPKLQVVFISDRRRGSLEVYGEFLRKLLVFSA